MSSVTDAGLTQSVQSLGLVLPELQRWLRQDRLFPLAPTTHAKLEMARDQLEVRVRQYQADPSLLTVMLVGGTGVGKSTLLNALAKSKVAQAGIVRPTTQRPTVYYHRQVDLAKLDPIFQQCDVVAHDRPELRYKLLIDTPDMDGNVKEHRERLRQILPVADAVLYVGSQEKYHDIEAWKILLEHRGARGFAFILNKWDRCLSYRDERTGESPAEDFRQSLREAGFESPLVFRTCAAHWVMAAETPNAVTAPIDDDFPALEQWLEAGLTERVIRDIKVRGMGGKIVALIDSLREAIPPDWSAKNSELKRKWEQALQEGLADYAQLLVEAADRNSPALEEHFSRMGRGDFRGIFAGYLTLVDYLRRVRLSPVQGLKVGPDSGLHALASRAVVAIPDEARRTQRQALRSHLLALADRQGWPLETFGQYVPDDEQGALGELSLTQIVRTELVELARDLAEPSGQAYATRMIVKGLCDWLPLVLLGLILLSFLYQTLWQWDFGVSSVVSSLVLFVLTLLGLHLLLAKTVPVRWNVLRNQFRQRVLERLLKEVAPRYLDRLDDFASKVATERATPVAALGVLESLRAQLAKSEQSGQQQSLFPRAVP